MSGIVFGCVVPHPPLAVPEIGRGQEQQIARTTRALHVVAERLGQAHPEVLVVVSPHGDYHDHDMGVLTAGHSVGHLRDWGARAAERRFDNDLELVKALREQAKKEGVALKPIGEEGYPLDHGVMVPMHFLIKGVEGVPLVPLTFSWLPLKDHFAFGRALKQAAEKLKKRVAVIASGDLSHRLIPGAPAGYSPRGRVFDQQLGDALSPLDARAILNLDPGLVKEAGECGLRSVVILLGALDGLEVKPEVLSYEGPFGVGYLVASFEVLAGRGKKPEEHPLVALARETVEAYVKGQSVPRPEELTLEMRERAGVFVSIKKRGELRGCIGTFAPTAENVAQETIANAVSSATRDPRFRPITPEELPLLSYSVDVLTSPQAVESPDQLDPRRYGVIVECRGRKGLLLPDLEGVDSVDQQIEICCQKAGIEPGEPLALSRFEVRRYK